MPCTSQVFEARVTDKPDGPECFAQSGVAWAGLGPHPHILRCHDVLRVKNTDEAYLVLQAAVPEKERDTSSLLSWLVPGSPLPVLQALLFALQIVRGLRYVEDKNLVSSTATSSLRMFLSAGADCQLRTSIACA